MKPTKLLVILPFLWLFMACSPSFTKYQEAAKSWEKEIQALEQRDQTEKDPENTILFIGSSSIRLWKNIKQDMSPYPVIQRGYGGAKFTDLIFYTKRLVYPHDFRALAVFVANDITGSNDDRTPTEVVQLFDNVVKTVRKKYTTKPIFLIAITPNSLRWKVWDKATEANNLLKTYCEKHKNLYFIETQSGYLGADGKPNDSLFIQDHLHLNQSGYDIWANLIKKRLDEVLK